MAGQSVSVVRVDLATYLGRLKHLQAFAPGDNGEALLVDPVDRSDAARLARDARAAALKAECTGLDYAEADAPPPQCGADLGPGMMAGINRDYLLARIGFLAPAPQEDAQ